MAASSASRPCCAGPTLREPWSCQQSWYRSPSSLASSPRSDGGSSNRLARIESVGSSPGQTDELTVAVNVSAYQLMSPDFVGAVDNVLSDTGTDPRLLTLEMTESVFLQDSERAQVVLGELKKIGVNLALDDFGTGYSSLNYLKQFPIDIVKIDRGFVADMNDDPASHAIVSAVIELAHLLGMTVVAEGVETIEQRDQLASLGCDNCQGFYFAHPMSANDMDALIREARPGSSLHLPATTGDHVLAGRAG